MKKLIVIALIILAILFAAVATLFGFDSATVDFFGLPLESSLAVWVFLALLVGAVLGMLTAGGALLRRGSQIRKLQKELKRSQDELNNLRKIPIKDLN